MAVMEYCVWRGFILALLALAVGARFGGFPFSGPRFPHMDVPTPVPANGASSGPLFMVTFPSVIQSGSESKLCASLLKPNESLTLTVSLFDDKGSTSQLVQQNSRSEFHRCFSFQAPRVDGDSIQKLRVDVQGRAFKMTEERKVMFRFYQPSTFIQTDKPLYNPGQTVNFRVVTLDTELVPLEQMYNPLVIEDNNNIRIAQWANVSSTSWLLELSYDLNPEAQVGLYTVRAFIGDRMISQVFEVKKYVLPKFDITVNVPQTYSVGDEGLTVTVCGRYTYGQPVLGLTLVQVCREPLPYVTDPGVTRMCQNATRKTNDTGCASLTLSTSAFFSTTFEDNLQNSFLVTSNLTEVGTDVVMSKNTTVYITFEVGKVSFVDVPSVFTSGTTVNGRVSASFFNGTLIPNKLIYLLESSQWPNKLLLNLTTDQNGYGTFSLDTANFPKADLNLLLSATPQVFYGYKSPYFNSDSRLVQLLKDATPDNPDYSKLTIQKLDQPLKCDSTYSIMVTYSFAGEAGDYSVDIVYMVLSRGIIVQNGFQKVQASDSVTSGSVSFTLTVSVSMAPVIQIVTYGVLPSQNVVSMQFSPVQAVPSEGNVLTVNAQAGSLCGIGAVDQSVLIMEPGRRLNAEMIFNLLPVQSLSDFPPGVEDEQECLGVRPRRAVQADKAYDSFKNVGMKIATNLPVREPQCLIYRGYNYYRNFPIMYRTSPVDVPMFSSIAGGESPNGGSSSNDVTVRTYFPETWLWQLAQVGASGSTSIAVTVPDTITTWEADAFCLSPKGFGLAPTSVLTVFQPFFLELTLPYSIVRGESLELKATVFNYLPQCIKVQVTPTPSSNFTLQSLTDSSSCLCANGRKTFRWSLTATVLGKLNITVSAQAKSSQTPCGTEAVVLPTRGRVDVVTQSLKVLAEGVERTLVQSLLLCPKGDMMGRALKNLNSLLQLPSGCGEQNMIILAPNIYILRYLEVTAQLTSTIRDTAMGYLQTGYQGQLNYRHTDGSYSTFGNDASNTWLTAFVLRSFGLAQSYIFIDPNVLQSAKNWLVSQQGSGGCFTQQGTLYHNGMKGGVGTKLHWSKTSSGDTLAVEISSYVLLAVLTKPSVTTANLGYANRIVSWLVTQQNPYGGFSSTQDTVVALHALSLYATKVFSLAGASSVTVQSSMGGEAYNFDVTNDNRLLYQEKPLKNVPGKYTVNVKGSACVSVQVACFYNIPTPAVAPQTLSVDVKVTGDCKGLAVTLTLNFTVKYSGPQQTTNMVLVDIKLLSGFTADTSLLGSQDSFATSVQRVDSKDDHVVVYLKEPLLLEQGLVGFPFLAQDFLTWMYQHLLFMVTFPSVIQSGSESKLCASLLKPNESLTLTVSLFDDKGSTSQLVQQNSRSEFHRCFSFQAPRVDGDSIQKLRVDVQGRAFKMTEERKVMFKFYQPSTFIQTDKPLYNPGQTVNFRVVTLDTELVPLEQMYNLVVIEDNNNIRIAQWANVSSTSWLLELSYDLNPEAQVGLYTVRAFIGDRMISQVFEVKKYVLPKFDITVNVPQTYSVGDEGLTVTVCGRYTYGQPVLGLTLVQVCREPLPYVTDPGVTRMCQNATRKTNDTGCASLTLSTSAFFSTTFEDNLQNSFLVTSNLTEVGTDVVMSKNTTVYITFEVGKVSFVDVPSVFTSGTTVNGRVSASFFNGTLIPNKLIYLLESSQWPNKLLLNLTTDQNGYGTFSLDTANFPKADLNLLLSATPQVFYGYKSPYFNSDSRLVQLLKDATPDNPEYSKLTIQKLDQPLKCDSTYSIMVTYSFAGEAGDYSVDIVYMVLSRGIIVQNGFQKVQASDSVTSGSVSFTLTVSVSMAPVIQIVTYGVLPSQNVVSMQFSPVQAVPSEGNVLTVNAQAGSLCGIGAVDQSVLIMEPGRRLNAEMIFNLLPVQSLSDFPPGVEDEQECLGVRPRRAVQADKAYDSFKNVGMKIATNLPVREPQCLIYRGYNYYRNLPIMYERFFVAMPTFSSIAEGESPNGGSSSNDVTVRTYFPETWLWQLAQVGASGSTSIAVTVPDTITTWEADAFCLSPKGFGLAPTSVLTVFQPFFLELTLPYSIVRGESLELKATVFNYLPQCIKVEVIPTPSSNFTLQLLTDSSSCLCANGRKTFRWSLTATVLGKLNITVSAQAKSSQTPCGTEAVVLPTRGRVDVVTRSLKVLAEGVERTLVQSLLLCPKGDMMGRALKNLNSLLQLPSGCGEQNMIILAPNIYILRYLEVTAQLTSTIRDTAMGYLQTGYQGQLNYRHTDGSYSTFGNDASNTWLTAFVLRSFGLAQSYIFIDPNVLQSAKNWLVSQQGSGGCFTQQGTLYHNGMKGGVGDNVTMTGLAGETNTRLQLLTSLNSIAISEGTKLHWSKTSSGDTLAVEISSYVLLAVLTKPSVTTANLGYANRIVSWLVTQQNPYGGFSSTQDTVVALHALSLYATKVFSLAGASSVTVQSSMGGEAYNFDVTNDNRLLYQEKPLKNVPGKYTVNVKGSACVSVQVACFYNIPTPAVAPQTLSVDVKVTGDCKSLAVTLTLNFTVKYSGPQQTTNMVLVDIKLLSGFTADTSLLGSQDSFATSVQRVDSKDDHVVVYLKEVPKGVPLSYRMQLKRVVAVQNLKPAVVNVYDYYR
ncbi:hypothetical protein DNTS_002941, partial [Danionella cerebrum]